MGYEAKVERDKRIKANLALPEAKIFVEMVRRARGDSKALSGVAAAVDALGLPPSWMRERMAGRIRIKSADLEILGRLVDIARSNPYHVAKSTATPARTSIEGSSDELRVYRNAVRRFCRQCVGADREDKNEDLRCPDAGCPLRGVSPLQLDDRPILVGETWD